MTKLNVPVNQALDMYELEELRLASMPKQAPQRIERSPSPQPGDVNYVDPDFDPDNVVIRGPASDDEDEEEKGSRRSAAGGDGVEDFTFNTHS